MFCSLLAGDAGLAPEAQGVWAIEVEDAAEVTQTYLRNTPILRTVIRNGDGAAVEIIDFAPVTVTWGGSTGRWPWSAWCGRCRARRASASACGR